MPPCSHGNIGVYDSQLVSLLFLLRGNPHDAAGRGDAYLFVFMGKVFGNFREIVFGGHITNDTLALGLREFRVYSYFILQGVLFCVEAS